MEFKFLNTKVDLSKLREGVQIDSNNQFLKTYDKNNNSIFDNEELAQFYSDLEPLINDGELDKNESISLLAKVLNTSVDAIKQRFSNQEKNYVFEGLEEIYSKSIQKDVLDNKTSEITQAMELYGQARGGKVSDTVHKIFNPDYLSDKVYRQLAREQVSVLLLHEAEGGNLTMKNYLERKIEFLECYLSKDKLNEKDKEFLTRGIRQLTPQELNNLIDKITDCDDNEFQQIVNQTLSDLKIKGENASNPNKSREIGFRQSANPNSIESILNSSDSEKVVDYESTFKIEYNTEFNEENIQNYYDKKSEFETASRIHNRIATQYNLLDEAINSNDSEYLKESIKESLTTLFGNNSEKKDDFLSKLGYSKLDSLNNEDLKTLAQDLQKELKTTLDKQLNGKTIEQYIEELENAETLAYGDKMNIKVAEKYAELTEKAVNNVKMAVSGVGFIATLAGGPMVLVGLGISVLGGAGVSFVEESTKGESIPEDKQKEILNELITSGLLTAAGFGSGVASNALRNLVATKCPTILAAVSEYGSDAIMSLLADYAITGQVDLTSEGISQLLNIATGVVAKNKIRKPKSSADADVKVRTNNDSTSAIVNVRKNSNNEYVIKIDDVEYTAKNNNELQKIISEKAHKDAIIDFSEIDTGIYCASSKTNDLDYTKTDIRNAQAQDLDKIYSMLDDICHKNNWNASEIQNYYLKGLSTDLKIFKDSAALEDYIKTVHSLRNTVDRKGKPLFGETELNQQSKTLVTRYDYDLIQGIALFKADSPEMGKALDNMCEMVKNGQMDLFEFKKNFQYLIKGYISPTTMNLAISNNYGGDFTRFIDETALDEDLVRTFKKDYPKEYNKIKENIKNRKTIIKDLKRVYSDKVDNELKLLKEELGKDTFYAIKWETLLYKNLNENELLRFIKDIRNIKTINDYSINRENYFINIKGYKRNQEWAEAMCNLTESSSVLIRSGFGFDETMQYIASGTRQYVLNNKPDYDLACTQGVLRTYRDGYISNQAMAPHGAITPFSHNTKYYSYSERFINRYGNKALKNPYEGRIELTRLSPNEKYPIEQNEYNSYNPKHIIEYDKNGNAKYYKITECMVHPEGRYGTEGLEIAKELHNKLISKYQGKSLNKKDLEDINETIGEIHWVIAHTMPWGRGSDGIANVYVKSLYQSLGIKTYPPREGISFDLEAFCTELEDYKKNYKKLYSQEPEIVN